MKRCLLDTDIFSEILKQKNQQVKLVAQRYLEIFDMYTISTVTILEVVKGLHKIQQEEAIQRFQERLEVQDIQVLTLTNTNAELGGRIYADLERTGQSIGLADSMIAAIAIEEGLALATGNERHYRRVQALGYDLTIENWKSPDESV